MAPTTSNVSVLFAIEKLSSINIRRRRRRRYAMWNILLWGWEETVGDGVEYKIEKNGAQWRAQGSRRLVKLSYLAGEIKINYAVLRGQLQ